MHARMMNVWLAPSAIWTFLPATGVGADQPITWPFVPEQVSPLEEISAKSRDGMKVTGVLRKPPGEGPFPVVVFLHGGLNRHPIRALKNSALKKHTFTRFLAAGYVTVAATYRDRRQDPQSPGALWDCAAITERVKQLPFVDADSVTVFGHSGGGSLALELAGEVELAAVVAGEPATCLFTGLHGQGPPNSHPHLYSDPHRYYTANVRKHTREKINKIQSPVLIVHSDVHDINKLNNAIFVPEMKALGKSLDTILYPGCRHGFYFGDNRRPDAALKAFNDSRAFVEKYIKVQPKPIDDPRVEQRRIEARPDRPSRRDGRGGRATFERVARRHDANGDGKVTREEFQGSPRAFDRLDRNGDGLITAEDMN